MINQDGKKSPAWTSLLIANAVGVAMVIAAAWVFFAPWFTAHNIISLWPERRSCWLAILAVIVCGNQYTKKRPNGAGLLSRKLRWCILLFALVVVFFGEAYSSNLFVYWKVRAIPPNVWAQMASDLQRVGKTSADNDSHIFHRDELPESLHRLGLGVDYMGGTGGWGQGGSEGDDFRAYVQFGYGLRTWGLFTAPNKLLLDEFASDYSSVTMVAPDAFFFLRPPGK